MVCVEQTKLHTPCCGECYWLDPVRHILPDLHPLSALNLLLCRKLKHGALIWPPEPQCVLVYVLLRHLINKYQVHLHDYPSVNCVVFCSIRISPITTLRLKQVLPVSKEHGGSDWLLYIDSLLFAQQDSRLQIVIRSYTQAFQINNQWILGITDFCKKIKLTFL